MSKINHRIMLAATLIAVILIGATLPSRIAGAQSTTLTINPTADAYVMEDASLTNFGNDTNLFLDKNPSTYSFVKFDVSGVGSGLVTRAILRFYAKSDNPKGYDIYMLSSSSWDEASIKYIDAPALGSVLNDSGPVSAGAWNEIDITSSIKGDGKYSFGLASAYGRKTTLSSREDNAHMPQLVLTVSLAEPTATLTTKPTTSQPVSVPTLTPTTSATGSPNTVLTATAKPTTNQTALPSPTATPTGQPVVQNTTGTFYVSVSGNDANPGTINQPWRTIQKAANVAVAGNHVYIRGGTYNERVLLNINSGTASNPIIFEAYPGETPIIDGSGIALVGKGLFEINGIGNIRVKGLKVTKSDDFGIYLQRSNHIEVLNNSTSYTHSSGISAWNSDSVKIDHNVVVNARYVTLAMGGHEESISIANTTNFEVSYNDVSLNGVVGYLGNEAIDTKDGSQFGSVHHNYSHGFSPDGGAIYADAWDSLTGNISIYSNRIVGAGLAFNSERGGTLENINAYNNTIYGVNWAGVAISNTGYASGGNGLRRNINIYNNTIYKTNGNGGAGIYIISSNIENIGIYNNIVSFNLYNGEITAAVPTILSKISAHNNLVFGPKSCAQDYPNCVEISNNPAGYPNIYGNVTADPKFMNLTGPDFHLQSVSPAIDKGYNLGLNFDFDGVARPQGSANDIGAYEYK